MDDVTLTQLGLTVVYGVVGGLLTLIERVERGRALRMWTLTLYLLALDALISALCDLFQLPPYVRATSWLALTGAGVTGVAATITFIGRPLPKGLFVLGAIGVSSTLGGVALGLEPDQTRVVVFSCVAVSFLWVARLTFEIGSPRGVGRWVAGSAFLGVGLYGAIWPYVCHLRVALRLEFYLDLSLVMWGVAGVLLIHFERSRERLQQLAAQELELRAQLERSERLEALGRLAGGVAHDFNNVLTTVIHGSELALRQLADRPKTAAHVAMVLEAAQGAAGFTRQLLTLGRRRLPGRKPRCVDEALRGAMAMVRPVLLPNHTLICPPVDSSATILAGEGQLEQVVVNLSLNAIEAMKNGGTLEVQVCVGPDKIRLCVRDTGCGMDEETLKRAFEPFFSTGSSRGGTGLGLATVYAIVEQLDGQIDAQSTPGAGSCFTVEVPRCARPEPSLPSPALLESTPSTVRILVVDDQESVLNSISAGLSNEGYQVTAAASGQDALSLLADQTPHLLLADVRMPGMSGLELAAEVRARHPGLPVIMMTGYASDEELDSRRYGTKWLLKPFTPQKLAAAIGVALGR